MIFPKPKKEEYCEGVYRLKEFDDSYDLMYLYNKYKNGNADVCLKKASDYGTDRYDITIDSDGIFITHGGDCGIFRAVSSLKQLLSEYGNELPYCTIEDYPDFEKRAYMLDISRGRMPKVSTIIRLIDLLASLKYNELQLYMEGIVFKYKNFPHLSSDFDCLTPEDIELLDKYCSERFIDLVPNQNSFGHMSSWVNRDEYLHLKVGPKEDDSLNLNPSATINPLLPESLDFMDSIYDSLLPHFSSDYVHIGLDEAHGMGTYELEEPCRKYGADNVFMDWLSRLSTLLRDKYGKKVQFWADMIYKYPDAFKRMPKDAVAMLWGYDVISTASMEARCINLASKGCEFYICPGDATWNSFSGRFDVMHLNLRYFADLGIRYGAKGYMLTSWGNGGHPNFPVWSVVPCVLAGQYSWNAEADKPGWILKTDFVRAAERFADRFVFDDKLSRLIYRLQRYYLMEPELMHDCTLTGISLRYLLDSNIVHGTFDLEECGDELCFDNIIEYVRSVCCRVRETTPSAEWKEQILCNCKCIVFASELNKIRLTKKAEDIKIKELIALADEIISDYDRLWMSENYPKGREIFTDFLYCRKSELNAMLK